MPAGDLVYGTRTALVNVSRLNSDGNGVATAFGKVDNSSILAPDYSIHIRVPINTLAVGGAYELSMIESQDDVNWTDSIDPDTDSNWADALRDAVFIKAAQTIYDNSPAGIRTVIQFHFKVCDYVAKPEKYFAFVLLNSSAQSIPSTPAAAGNYESIKYATS